MKRESLMFAIILVGMAWLTNALQIRYADEVWLISGLVAGQLAFLIRRDRTESYLAFNGPVFFVVAGAYILLMKAPVLLSKLIALYVAQLLGLAIYLSIGWFLVKRRV